MALVKEIIHGSGNWNTIIYSDGTKYIGYTDGKEYIREGLGTLYDENGVIIARGVWSKDEIIEEMDENEYNKQVNTTLQHTPHW